MSYDTDDAFLSKKAPRTALFSRLFQAMYAVAYLRFSFF